MHEATPIDHGGVERIALRETVGGVDADAGALRLIGESVGPDRRARGDSAGVDVTEIADRPFEGDATADKVDAAGDGLRVVAGKVGGARAAEQRDRSTVRLRARGSQ